MEFNIEIKAIANQSIKISAGGARWEIILNDCDGFMVSSIRKDGVAITDGIRIVYGTPLLPYKYMEQGNFVLYMDSSRDRAAYQRFGIDQFLYYIDQEGIDALRSESS